MTTRKHRRKAVSEPLVTINGTALKQAIVARGLTVRGIAKRLRVSAPTLQYAVAGDQKRVRLGLFKGLVKLLRGRLSPADFTGLLRGEATAARRPLLAGRALDVYLATRGHDAGDVELIADRAFRAALHDAKEFWIGVLPGYPEQTTSRVQYLYHPDTWRRALFGSAGSAPSTEIDAAAGAASEFWRIVFRPLLEGSAKLRPGGAAQRLAAVARRVFTGSITDPRAWSPKQKPTLVGPHAALRKRGRTRSPQRRQK